MEAPTPLELPLPPVTDQRAGRPLARVHKVALILGGVIFWAPILLVPVFMEVHDYARYGRAVGGSFLAFLVVVGIAALIDRASRRWSRWPGVTALLAVACVVLSIFVMVFSRARTARRIAEFDRAEAAHHARLREIKDMGGSNADMWPVASAGAAELNTLAKGLPTRAVTHKLVLAEEMVRIFETGARYQSFVAEYDALGGLSVDNIRSVDAIEARRECLRAVIAEHTAFMESMAGISQRVTQRLNSADAQARLADPDIVAFLSKMAPDAIAYRLHVVEHDILTTQDTYWRILHEAWGHWTRDGNIVRFGGPNADDWAPTFDTACKSIQSLREKQVEMKRLDESERGQD